MTDTVGPLAILAAVLSLAVLWYVRERRNGVLEHMLTQNNFGSPEFFHGTLVVNQYDFGEYLQLGRSTPETRRLYFLYRWLGFAGAGAQAVFSEVTFDASRSVVELKTKKRKVTRPFSEIVAIRMREKAGRGGIAVWHIDLLPQKGKAIPFVTSERGYRQAAFEHTAPLAKAVSTIMAVPVHVLVAGNVWTPGWPPKASIQP